MAVTFDASSSAAGNGTTTITWAHTTSGTNRYLLVLTDPMTGPSASSVTYNSVALTLLGSGIWGLVAPATGANSVVITYPTATDTTAFVSALSFNGVDQSVPTAATKSGADLVTIAIESPSTNSSGMIASIVKYLYTGVPLSIVSGTTREKGNGGLDYAQSATQVGGTAVTSWTTGAPAIWSAACVLVLPLGVTPTTGAGINVLIKKIYRSVLAPVLKRSVLMGSVNRKFKV